MMDLILWRHAEALDESEAMEDLQRPLTSRGEKQAARMAAWLDRQLPDGARVICSPARRTEQTALALGRKYKLRAELLPGCTPAELLELAQWPKGKGTVLNREIFNRAHFAKIQDVDPAEFSQLIDTWAIEYAELYAAKSRA